MKSNSRKMAWTAASALLLATWSATAGEYETLLAKRSAAIVTLRFVLDIKIFGGSQGEEEEMETSGVMISPRGLVICSNTGLSGFTTVLQNMMGGSVGTKMSATPKDIKILIGDDQEGMDAKLLTRDTELDLAWIQINDPGKKRYDYVDFSRSAKPKPGQRLLSVWRKDKYFDRVAIIGEGRVAGIARKPRTLYITTGDMGNALGLPVFTPDGKAVGVSIVQVEESDIESARPNPLRMFTKFLSFKDALLGNVLPGQDVVRATERALKSAKDKRE